VVGSAAEQQAIEPLGRNAAGDWLQIQAATGEAWIAAFLVENVDASALPVRESTAPTITPLAQPPAATPRPTEQVPPTTGTVACGVTLPAPTNLEIADQFVELKTFDTRLGPVLYTRTAKRLSWRWPGLDQIRGADWYFDVQVLLGDQVGNPLLRTLVVNSDQATNSDGLWTAPAPGTTAAGNAIAPEFFTGTCPPGDPRCPLHVRVQVALRDGNGAFACFVSPPSNIVPLPLP
jgi:hypothetical protein